MHRRPLPHRSSLTLCSSLACAGIAHGEVPFTQSQDVLLSCNSRRRSSLRRSTQRRPPLSRNWCSQATVTTAAQGISPRSSAGDVRLPISSEGYHQVTPWECTLTDHVTPWEYIQVVAGELELNHTNAV
ncbi:hypothetical protein PIB30_002017 [Stylosanthes scabra]|uniref:Uncharacterized protein n=1 Tax=Stylosanthes scabra TaxID=79078 RepID=A0ABU6Q2R3_9FABA|nr:hypothetical protein [Stylosanthes scabra]